MTSHSFHDFTSHKFITMDIFPSFFHLAPLQAVLPLLGGRLARRLRDSGPSQADGTSRVGGFLGDFPWWTCVNS